MSTQSGLSLRFLGTGDAGGVPLFGCHCEICEQARVGDGKRAPCSSVLHFGESSLLIDAGRTDLAELFYEYHFERILLTHYHVDHVQGLFHIRWGKCEEKIPVNGPEDRGGCADLHKHAGILDFSDCLSPLKSRIFNQLTLTPLPLNHSKITLGYGFEFHGVRLAYLTDTLELPNETESFLISWRPDFLIVDCTHAPDDEQKRNHNDLNDALDIHRRLSPQKTWLTHISHDMDLFLHHNELKLPPNVYWAKDKQQIRFESVPDL